MSTRASKRATKARVGERRTNRGRVALNEKQEQRKVAQAERLYRMMEQRIKEKRKQVGYEMDKLVDWFVAGRLDYETFQSMTNRAQKKLDNFIKQRRQRQVKHLETKAELQPEFIITNKRKTNLFDRRDNIANYSYKVNLSCYSSYAKVHN